jgi:hypothetical protein
MDHTNTSLQESVTDVNSKGISNATYPMTDKPTANITTSTKQNYNHSTDNNVMLLLLLIVLIAVIGYYSSWIQPRHLILRLPQTGITTMEVSDHHHIHRQSPTPRRMIDTVMDTMCAPVRPDTIWTMRPSIESIRNDVIHYEAPWWVPSLSSSFLLLLSESTPNLKDYVFHGICTSRQRTRIEVRHNSMSIYLYTNGTNISRSSNEQNMPIQPLGTWKLDGVNNIIAISSNEITILRSISNPSKRKWNMNAKNDKRTTTAPVTKQFTVEYIMAPWSIIMR